MDRREFIRVSATGASGILVLGAASCASVPKIPLGRPEEQDLPDMESYLARVDAGMRTIARWSPTEGYPGYPGDRAAADRLARGSLRTLYMTAMFSDLPEAGQRHVGMQDRIWAAMPEMDEATAEMEAFLASRSDQDLRTLQGALRSSRNPGMEIFGALDQHAAACGVSLRRRLQTRVLMTEANWRLRNQPPSLVVQESLEKVRKVTATDISRAGQEDWIAARAGEAIFWQEQLRTDVSGEATAAPDSARQGRSLRQKRLRRGARLMGIGLLVGGVAAAATAAGAVPFVFVATVGAVMILVGLITLLVGIATSSSARTDE